MIWCIYVSLSLNEFNKNTFQLSFFPLSSESSKLSQYSGCWHDDAMPQKCFLHHWAFVWGIHRPPRDAASFWCFFVVSLNMSDIDGDHCIMTNTLKLEQNIYSERNKMWVVVVVVVVVGGGGGGRRGEWYIFAQIYSINDQSALVPVRHWHHDDIIKWKHFPHYWPLVRGIHQSLVDSPHKGQWRRALILNGCTNNGDPGDLRHQYAHDDVTNVEQAISH